MGKLEFITIFVVLLIVVSCIEDDKKIYIKDPNVTCIEGIVYVKDGKGGGSVGYGEYGEILHCKG